jgi:transposase
VLFRLAVPWVKLERGDLRYGRQPFDTVDLQVGLAVAEKRHKFQKIGGTRYGMALKELLAVGNPDDPHRVYFEGRLPLARLSGGVWSAHYDLQSVQPMVEGWHLADDAGSAGRAGIGRSAEHRQHHLQGPSLRRRGKRGAQEQAIGRSRGGRTTKIHAVANASGRLIAFDLTAGQMGDIRSAPGLIEKLPKAAQVLADTAYESDKFREFLIARGSTPVTKPNPTRKKIPPFDAASYKGRNVIKRAFSHLKDWRRVATRYDKLARSFRATVTLALLFRWWI